MKLDAVGVTTNNIQKAIEFYSLIGFKFPETKEDEGHIESVSEEGSIRLMIDKTEIVQDMINEEPIPSDHSSFAVKFENPEQVDEISKKIKEAGFNVFKEPWDAFWGQRYAVVEDPDGYKVDFYAQLK